MTRRGWTLGVATAATLLLSAWVAAAGPVGIFAAQSISGKLSSAPGEEYASGAIRSGAAVKTRAGTTQTDSLMTAIVSWVLIIVLVAVAVFVLVAVVRSIRDTLARHRVDPDEEGAVGELTPERLRAAAQESEELLARGTPSNGVIAAWVSLEDAITSAGIHQNEARTPAEIVTAVMRSYAVDAGALDRLASLYREARFSRHEVGEDMRDQARAALRQVTADLARAEAPKAARPARAGAGGPSAGGVR